MAKSFEFFFDYVSATAYLAFYIVPKIAERTSAQIIYRPMFLGGVMQATGNTPPGMVPAKGAYYGIDMQRCARHIGIPFHANPHFPANTLKTLRATIGLEGNPEEHGRFMAACFRNGWGIEAPLDLGSDDDIKTICEEAGLDPARILALGSDAVLKEKLKSNTEEAVARGAFGAPTFFVGDEIFFGHDRLDYVERALMT